MYGLKIAVPTRVFGQSLKQALHTARRCHVDGVQIDARFELRPDELSETAARQLRKMLDDLDLRVASLRFPARRGYADPGDLQRRIDATLACLPMADRLAARLLACPLGPLPSPDSPQRSELTRVLERLAAAGERYGVRIALEASEAEPAELRALLAGLSPGGIGVDFSPADLILHRHAPVAFLEALGDRVVHVRANDAIGGLGGSVGAPTTLGRGSADFADLIARLEQYGYRDWVTIDPRDAADPCTAVDDATALLRSL